MSNKSLIAGPLQGRFYTCEVEPNLHLVRDAVIEFNRRMESVPKMPAHRGLFCTSDQPHAIDATAIMSESAELGYSQPSDGMVRMWLREETRKVPKLLLEQRAQQYLSSGRGGAWSEFGDVSWSQIPPKVRKEICQHVKEDMIPEMTPHVSVTEVVAFDRRVFIARRSPDALVHYVGSVLGKLTEDPVAWKVDSTYQFKTLSQVALEVVSGREENELDADVSLTALSIGEHEVSLRSTAENHSKILKTILEKYATPMVKMMRFDVHLGGDTVDLVFDSDGLYRAEPPYSAGGFLEEQIRRRMEQTREAGERVGEVLTKLHEEMSPRAGVAVA